MAGWTYTGATTPINTIHGPDDAEKASDFPALGAGNAGWIQDWCWKVRQDFTAEAKRRGGIATVAFSANNSTGDTTGVGTFTITIVTT